MIVHWGGYPVDLDRIKKIQQKTKELYGFEPIVIEDCAHGIGSTYKGKRLGNHGNLCMFSFQAIKHITAVDGGMLTLPNKDLYDKLEDTGYKDPGESGYGGIKKGFKSDLFIEQVNAEGNTIEKWTLSHFMIKSVTFGDLSYDDDGLVEIALTIAYDWAEFE